MRAIGIIATFALLLLSGCVDCGAPFTARTLSENYPSEAGSGDRTVRVTVVDDDGSTPANLIAWWAEDEDALDGAGPLTLVLSRMHSSTGTFVAHVPSDRTIHFTAAWDHEHTEEWLLDALAPATESASLTIHLYNAQKTATIQDTWSGATTSGCTIDTDIPCPGPGGDAPAWQSQPIRFHDDPIINAGYLARLASLQGALEWTNTATDSGSFGLGFGQSSTALDCLFDDDAETPGEASHRQPFELPVGGESECDERMDWQESVNPQNPPTHVGPTAAYLAAPLEGVDYSITMEGQFRSWNPIQSMCDGFGDREYDLVDDESGRLIQPRPDPEPVDSDSDPDREPVNPLIPALFGGLVALVITGLIVWSVFTQRRQR